jgi:hypothetical protein
MAFGKKPAPKSQAAVQPELDVHEQAFVEMAERLTPAERNNIWITRAYREGIALEQHYMMDYLGQVNTSLPDGINVEPYMMVPGECWNGPWGDLLVKYLEVSPFGSWNVVFLPRDERSADALMLMPHPGPASQEDIDWANDVIGQMAEIAKTQSAEIERSGLDESEQDLLQAAACNKLEQLALTFGADRIGEKWLSRALWRFSTKEGMAQPVNAPR